jgi:hypothetical protein
MEPYLNRTDVRLLRDVAEGIPLTAQDLYDRRDERGEIDGRELHEIFQAICGDPSPTGRTAIDTEALRSYAAGQRGLYAAHKASGGVGGEYLISVASFCESFYDLSGNVLV